MGHALNNTLQDILIRWRRMQGRNTLWVPGTDHAGIATQNVVEKQLLAEGRTRDKLGRDRFIQKVWEWKAQSGGAIIEQLKRLGSSCDWDRLRFTMDEGLSKAVREVFVRLYEDGLIYRGERLINWCPRCLTALSDIEVEHEDATGWLYHIRYPLADDPTTHLDRRDDATRNLVGGHRRRRPSGGSSLQPVHREARQAPADTASHPSRRGLAPRGSGIRHRGGQDHAGARLQRFRGWPAPQLAAISAVRPAGTPRSSRPARRAGGRSPPRTPRIQTGA